MVLRTSKSLEYNTVFFLTNWIFQKIDSADSFSCSSEIALIDFLGVLAVLLLSQVLVECIMLIGTWSYSHKLRVLRL